MLIKITKQFQLSAPTIYRILIRNKTKTKKQIDFYKQYIIRINKAYINSIMSAPKIINVLAISGSLRKASANSGLVRHAMKIANSRNDVSISTFDIGKLPLFNEDLSGKTMEGSCQEGRCHIHRKSRIQL